MPGNLWRKLRMTGSITPIFILGAFTPNLITIVPGARGPWLVLAMSFLGNAERAFRRE